MKKLDLTTLPKKAKISPLLKGLPQRLKEPEMFYKIEKQLSDLLKTDHTHKTVKEYVLCAWCNKKRELRQNKIKSLGFKNTEQYFQWKKIMTIITKKANFQLN